jgi:plastocyanin
MTATTVPTASTTGVIVPVIALDNSFRPEIVEISVGDEVLWENRGLNEHNVLRVEGEGWGVDVDGFQPGDVYRHVFTEPGEYRYYCSIHGSTEVGMVGTVVVTG